LIPYDVDTSWIEPTLTEIKNTLLSRATSRPAFHRRLAGLERHTCGFSIPAGYGPSRHSFILIIFEFID
ncbi:MAG: hypothetical protein P8X93_08635, partial [Gammaproteobacteria bacterium]